MSDGYMIRPVTITEAMLVSSNAVETVDLWDDSLPYQFYYRGAVVRSGESNRLYESIVGTGFDSGLCSITNANPAVVTTETPHGLSEYDPVVFTSVGTGSFPSEVTPGEFYLVHVLSATTFNLYSDDFEPIGGNLVDTSADSGSGLHAYAGYDLNTGYGFDPGIDDYDAETSGLFGSWITVPRWLDLGPANTWAMFDGYFGTKTIWAGDGEVVLAPGTRVDAMGLDGLEGTSLRVRVNDGAGDVYDETYTLVDNSEVIDWHSFFFGTRARRTTLPIDDLPEWVLAPEITISLTAAGGVAEIGVLQIGRKFSLGSIEEGLQLGIRDYSRVDFDEDFGTYEVTQRSFSKKAQGRALLGNTRVDAVQRTLAGHRTTPVFWCFDASSSAAVVFGFYRSFNIEVAYDDFALVSYEIEGVT